MSQSKRQIILDTETTGLSPQEGHKIIEIGCVELIDRRLTGNHWHRYINPQREIEREAADVHGITHDFLQDKPLFADIVEEFVSFVKGAELVIHNAPFDIGFINYELKALSSTWPLITQYCSVLDTLQMARKLHPGQRNSLDALCKRYDVDNAHRNLHGALLDAELLALLYLAMTGGQESLRFEGASSSHSKNQAATTIEHQPIDTSHFNLVVPAIAEDEVIAHKDYLKMLSQASGQAVEWSEDY